MIIVKLKILQKLKKDIQKIIKNYLNTLNILSFYNDLN